MHNQSRTMAWLYALTLVLAGTALAQASCPTTAGYFGTATSCYYLGQNPNFTWVEARQYCVSIFGGDLVSLQTKSEQTYVKSQVSGSTISVWIGLNDRVVEGNYTWTQTPITLYYTNWRPGEPNNVLDEDCVIMDVNGNWQDISCSNMNGFICERPAAAVSPPPYTVNATYVIQTSSDCGSGNWYIYKNFCYKFVRSYTSFDNSRKDCFSQGGTLATILSLDERHYIEAFLQQSAITSFFYSVRIGLNDMLDEGNYVWDDGTIQGSPLGNSIANWGRGQPNDQYHLEDCVEIQRNTYTWNDMNCQYYRPYICKRQSQPGATNSTVWPPTLLATKCPSSATTFHHPNGAVYCYTVYGATSSRLRLSWTAARAACTRLGSTFDLLSIHDHLELNAVVAVLKAQPRTSTHVYWIGINDRNHEGGYIWSDGTPTDYIHWDAHQPDNYRGTEDCGMLWNINNGKWNDGNCNGKNAYICKQTLAPPPNQVAVPSTANKYCPGGWVSYGSYCYLLHAETSSLKTHSDAVAACNAAGSNSSLASIHSVAEMGFIMAQFGNQNVSTRVFIGLSDIKLEGEFRWDDGSLVTYTNWHTNEPNSYNGGEDCVEMDYTAGWWNDQTCSSKRGYVCKMLKNMATKPPSQPAKCQLGTWYNNKCYVVSVTPLPYVNAQATCQLLINKNGLKGTLVTIPSRYYQFIVASVVMGKYPNIGNSALWIGLNDMAQEGVYVWTSKAPVTYSNWDSHQPDDWRHSEDCASWRTATNKWNDLSCTATLNYICEVADDSVTATPPFPTPAAGNPNGRCAPGWHKFRGFCYGFFGALTADTMQFAKAMIFPLQWTDTYSMCQSMGANLVTIPDNGTQVFLTNHIATGDEKTWYSFWTGLNDRGMEGGYAWVDGSALGFTNWALGEPNDNNGAEDCVENIILPSWTGFTNKWNDQSCRSTRPYVCQIVAGSPVTMPPPPTPAPPPPNSIHLPNCPVGWITTSSSCYKLGPLSSNVSFSSARSMCRTVGALAIKTTSYSTLNIRGDLASLHSSLDLITIVQAIKIAGSGGYSAWWIGLNDNQKEGEFTWTDGTPVNFLAWAEDQPNNWQAKTGAIGQDCGEILSEFTYLMNDDDCSNQQPYVCGFSRYVNQSHLPTTMNPVYSKVFCNPGWTKWQGKCYREYTAVRLPWSEAQFNCSLSSGSLLVVNSPAEQAFVTSRITKGGEYIWIGLNDKDREGTYRWVDGTNFGFARWGPGQPNNYRNAEDCVALHSSDSMWYDRDCTSPYAFVCEVPLLAMNFTTQPMTAPPTTVPTTAAPTTAAPTTTPMKQTTKAMPPTTTATPAMTTASTKAMPQGSTAMPAKSSQTGTSSVTTGNIIINSGNSNAQVAVSLGVGATAGIAVTALLVLIGVGLLAFYLVRRRRRAAHSGQMSFRALRTTPVNGDDDDDDLLDE